jgi:predicted regulator of Ras-like GTPase activity (Roadblock/LC7/MglB family)
MGTVADHLHMLRDVEGVHGSFVIAGTGSLVDSDLPPIFDSDLLGEVGARISRLFETFFSGGGDMETCVLRYSEHKVYIRKTTWGIIGVLSTVGVNLSALRMVANLVVRRIDPEIAALSTMPSSIAPSSSASSSAAKTVPAPGPSSSPPRSVDPRASALLTSLPAHDPLPVIPEDGRDASMVASDRHVRMYRGRPVDE